MAITLIRKKISDGTMANCLFKTEQVTVKEKPVTILKICITDDKLQPLTRTVLYDMTTADEITFHKGIRKEAAEKKQLVTSHCTDPEWNPENYSKNLEEFIEDESGK